jgi:hypothetical protein
MKRLLITAVTFCGILLGLATTPAKAVTFDVICTGTDSQTYSPGLLITPRTVTINLQDKVWAVQVVGPDPDLRIGRCHRHAYGLVPGAYPIRSSRLVSWNNGKTSEVVGNFTAVLSLSQEIVVFSGTVIAGEFKGDKVVATSTSDALNVLACLAPPGVTSSSGAEVLAIIKP